MLGAAHACANPLTSGYGVAHGAAVLLMLPHVIRYNEPVAGRMYAELLAADQSGSSGGIAERVTWMRDLGGLPARLRDAGVPADALARLAGEAAQQWTAEFNPRPVAERDLRTLYESAY
jgi:alcohol dehydrogenase